MTAEQEDAIAEVPATVASSDAAPPMHPNTEQRVKATRLGLSLDWWAVIVAMILAGLIVSGLLPPVGW
ncbi:MAG: hypothetical protein BWX88_04938 [Planctomycetes bacterium ADurb.Bin126]|nr:MAG: hypothetical protein BWX88_04938 [Planctomycetes bacterium ADurb.Bin126]HOD84256.1 hypothetical protein [Phycisphaerae bacterium]HQL75954.1 hypothetical protein [Phycisphaerae bacterium]